MSTPTEDLVGRLARIKTLQEELERACAESEHRRADDRVREEVETRVTASGTCTLCGGALVPPEMVFAFKPLHASNTTLPASVCVSCHQQFGGGGTRPGG